MRTSIVALSLAAVLLAAACDSRPESPAFNETTTTTTTLPGTDIATTTTVTLPPPDVRVSGTVESTVDGDTVKININGTTSDVRLLGINAPEMDECWGQEASLKLAEMVDGQEVLLASGPDDIDSFGRLLRYVYLEGSGEPVFVNAAMVETGNAVGLQDGSDFAGSIKSYEARAFQSGYGMWATFACGDLEGTSVDRPVIRVSELASDPAGPDADVLSEEYITIVNEGYDGVSIAGWTLRDESASNRYTFEAGQTLDLGESITVVTGCSGGPAGAVYWCNDQAVWSNGGDTAIVLDTLGNAVVWYTYGPTG
jgi:endonuclease YncB( thermonuclease family)